MKVYADAEGGGEGGLPALGNIGQYVGLCSGQRPNERFPLEDVRSEQCNPDRVFIDRAGRMICSESHHLL